MKIFLKLRIANKIKLFIFFLLFNKAGKMQGIHGENEINKIKDRNKRVELDKNGKQVSLEEYV